MARLLVSCAVVLVMLVVAPAASAMLVDPVAHSAQACSILGTRGADRLSGTAGDDRVCGLGGADRMRGQRGHDVLVGGAGADDLRGGAGRDALGGGLGADELSGGAGRDIAYFGQRRLPVRVTIGAGANDGTAGEGDDAHADVEDIRTGPGNDVLRGSGGSNRLNGAGGRDQLFGGRGNDVLVGGGGDDRLEAREGAAAAGRAAQAGFVDRVICGAGNDTALVDPVDVVDPSCESVVGAAGPTPPSPPAPTPPVPTPPAPPQNPPPPPTDDNESPTISTTGAALAYTEDDPATVVDSGLIVADPDDSSLAGARVAISAGFEAGDELLFSTQSGITGAYDAGTGVLTLTGTASLGDYQTALSSVEYRHAGDDPATVKAVEFRADDGDGLGPAATRGVDVVPEDDAPTAVNDSRTVVEGSAAIDLDVLANDSDVDGGLRSIAAASDPANGTVAVTGGGTGLTYQPDAGYCNDGPGGALDTFTYTLNGGSTAAVAVTVACIDAPPTAANDSATVGEDSGAGAINVLANDTDTDAGPKSIASVTQPRNGSVVITGGGSGLTYQPNANYCNNPPGTTVETFQYTLNGGSTATVRVVVSCVDDVPTAVADSATVSEDSGAAARDVLANDLNVDGGPMTIASASDPANGTVVVNAAGTGLTYQPDPNYCNDGPGGAPDTFTYTLNGGSPATVSMTVTCAPDDPVLDTSAGSASYTENATATVIDAGVTVADVDAGTTITGATVKITTGYASGQDVLALAGSHTGITATFSADTLTLTGNATVAAYQAALREVTYRNSSDNPATAARTITFTVTDATNRTGSDTRGVTISATDDPPTAVNDSASILEDATATAITVLTNDTDPDGGTRSIASVTQPTNGTVVITGGGTGLTYQPSANYCNNPPGTASSTFTYTLNGGSQATVSVTVTCVNDAPVADDETFSGAIGNTSLIVNDPDDGTPALSTPKKTIGGDILAGDSDIDGPGPLTVTAGTFATTDGGSVTIEADGDFTYNPAATSCTDTTDTFNYTLEDSGTPELTDTGTVTIQFSGCVWYVHNNAAGNSGTASAPFDTIDQAETASGANHTVFVFDGTGAAYAATGGYAMNAGERLIGEHEGLQVGTDTLHPANAGAHPTLTATGADVIDLDDGNEVRGFNLDPQGAGGGIAGSTGDVSGTIDDVNILDTGTAGSQPGLELDGTTGTFAVSNLTVSTNGATGVRLNNAGTVTFAPTGNISITTSGAPGLIATGGGATGVNLGTSTFDAITVTGSGTGGVSMTNTTGTTTFADLALTNASGTAAAFALSNAGTVSVPATGTANLNATGGPALDVTGSTVTTLAFDAVSSTNSTTDGINLAGLGTGTFSATSGTITGAAGIAFDLDGGTGDVTFPGTITNGQGSTAEITGRTGGTVTLSGPITESGDTDTTQENGGIAVTGNTGGATVASNATKTFNTGEDHAIVMGTSDGHTLTLSGGTLDIDTTSGAGLQATTSGTLNVTGSGNTIDSISATALNVANTDIGAGNLSFVRVSSGNATAAADPVNGIVLNNTGTAAGNGGLVVSGDGGGSSNGSGGVIQNTTATGVSLTSTRNVSLGYLNVTNSGDDGLHGNAITNFTLNRANVNNNGNSTSDDGVQFGEASGSVVGVLGTLTIANSSVSANAHNGFWVRNTSGTLTSMSVTGSSFNDVNDVTGANAFLFEGSGTSTLTAGTISGSAFQNNTPQRALEVQAHETATVGTMTVSGNTFTDNGIHASFTQDTSSNLTFKFLNNGTAATPMTGSILQAVNVFSSSQSTGGTLVGTISGNRIGNPSVAGSAGGAGGISGVIQGQTDATLLVDGNIIRQTSGDARAIGFAFRGAAPPLATTLPANNVVSDLTLTNNDVVPGSAPSGFPLSTIMVEADNQTGADNKSPTVRADIRGNIVPTTPVFDLVSTQIGFFEYDATNGHGIGQLVDTPPASADATAQLTSTNTGSASAFGVALIPGPITTPP